MSDKKEQNDNLQPKPPVVVILGHVDHGKTSILDFIRKSKVTQGESGGITQHIGAYQIEHNDKKITFIDTPGHEAFSAMRSRGAKVADIAILVIAAEEGIKPQTKEAIDHIRKTGTSLIVALNKIDKKEARPQKIKEELAGKEIIVESMGGQIPCVEVSAKTGQGINDLLEMILLMAEMEELKASKEIPASGVIIESNHNKQRGATATLLIKEGTLTNKDIIGTDTAYGRIKTMEDFQSNPIKKANPSTPVIITGFDKVPQTGEKFSVFENIGEAQTRVEKHKSKTDPSSEKEILHFESDKKVMNIILKADVQGSLEAIKKSLKTIPDEEVVLRILKAEVGDITESDIKLAESSQARIIGFRIKPNSSMKQIAQHRKIRIDTFEVIYELIQTVREMLSKLLAPEVIRHNLGKLKVLALFKKEKDRQVVGGKVISGQIRKNSLINVIRNEKKVGQGKIIQLQRDKKETEEVSKEQECGILFQGNTNIEEKDILEFYQEERKKREI